MSSTALTPIQEQVIALMAAGLPIRKITAEAQIHRNTIGNWRRTNPAFAQALADAQYDRVLYWRDAAEEHAALAVHTIAEILHNPHASPSVRLRAALAILQQATTLPPESPAVHPSACPIVADVVAPKPIHVVQPPPPHKMHNPAQRPTPKKHSKPPRAAAHHAA